MSDFFMSASDPKQTLSDLSPRDFIAEHDGQGIDAVWMGMMDMVNLKWVVCIVLLIVGARAEGAALTYARQSVNTQMLADLDWKASHGDIHAQNKLGQIFEKGQGSPKNSAKAISWRSRAAAQGDAEAIAWLTDAAQKGNSLAQANLGFLYENGRGVAEDDSQAAKWLLKAASQGNGYAIAEYGAMNRGGKGLREDYRNAASWYVKAAEQDNRVGLYYIGLAYAYGEGWSKDLIVAYALLSTLPPYPDDSALDFIPDADEVRKRVIAQMSPLEIQQGDVLKREIENIGALDALGLHRFDAYSPEIYKCNHRNSLPPGFQCANSDEDAVHIKAGIIARVSANQDMKRSFDSATIQAIKRAWAKPARDVSTSCVLHVEELPGGEVAAVKADDGCFYDDVIRASLEAAVRQAQPLPYKGYESVYWKNRDLIFKP